MTVIASGTLRRPPVPTRPGAGRACTREPGGGPRRLPAHPGGSSAPGKASQDATGLLTSGAAIYLTNIIAFGLWFWEIDRGGPFARARATSPHPDFLFPQMSSPDVAHPDWEPRFVDYLYVSFTNAVAFSPTDTMPLTRRAKALMALQSLVALSTIGLVIARAVNVLK